MTFHSLFVFKDVIRNHDLNENKKKLLQKRRKAQETRLCTRAEFPGDNFETSTWPPIANHMTNIILGIYFNRSWDTCKKVCFTAYKDGESHMGNG